MKIYIQTNNQQRLAAKIAKASFIERGFNKNNIFFLDLEENKFLKSYLNSSYIRNGILTKYNNDLQSFTLLRFFAPEMNKYNDKILVIDPDVFACKNPESIFNNLHDEDEICCTFYNNCARSEVMLINAKKVRWNFKNIIKNLFDRKIDYNDLINLNFEKRKKKEINKIYNSHDFLNDETVLLHTSRRITQPWKEGLKIDFDKKHYPLLTKYKNFIKKLLGLNYNKGITEKFYIKHPNPNVIRKVRSCYEYALKNNIISLVEVNQEIIKGYVSDKFIN